MYKALIARLSSLFIHFVDLSDFLGVTFDNFSSRSRVLARNADSSVL